MFEDKLCKDCKFYDASSADAERRPEFNAICRHPRAKEQSLVTGAQLKPEYCASMRISGQRCGPEATLFEPKEDA